MTLKPSVFHGSVDVPLPNDRGERARRMALCAELWSQLLSGLEEGVARQEEQWREATAARGAAIRAMVTPKPNGAPVESKPPEPKQRKHAKRKRGRR